MGTQGGALRLLTHGARRPEESGRSKHECLRHSKTPRRRAGVPSEPPLYPVSGPVRVDLCHLGGPLSTRSVAASSGRLHPALLGGGRAACCRSAAAAHPAALVADPAIA